MPSKRRLLMLCLSFLTAPLWAAESGAGAPAGEETAKPTIATANPNTQSPEDLKSLRERIAKQEEQIKQLQQAVEEQRAVLDRAIAVQDAAPAAVNVADSVANKSGSAGPVQLIPTTNVVHPRWGGAAQKSETAPQSPLGISIGSSTFTPFGFMDFTWFGRSTNLGSGIGTSFQTIPFNNVYSGQIAENNFSAQNSRLGFRVDSTVLGAKVLGYIEADFGFNNLSNNFEVTSNSGGFRMRNYFVDVQKNGLEILAGQDWSLLTPTRKGLSPIPADIFYTQDMDTNYQNGLVWTRAPQIRVIGHPTDNLAFGAALENPEQFTGNAVTFASTLPSTIANQFGGASGATGTNVPNLHPDIIFKAAYDGHVGDGQVMHIEAGAVVRSFRDVISSTTNGYTTYTKNTAQGFAGEVNGNFEVFKNFRLIANTFFGQGNGRYIGGEGPDLIVRADGTISPVHSYSTVDGFEATIKNTLIYGYYGGAYFKRNVAAAGSSFSGYGYPGSANTHNRSVQEATFGVVQTFWKNSNYGALAVITQYSYLWRNPWYLAVGASRYAKTNMAYVDIRYTLP